MGRYWKKGDVIEVDMPFTKHITYGADKLSSEVAISWKDATLNIDSRLSTITVGEQNGIKTGYMGNLLKIAKLGDKLVASPTATEQELQNTMNSFDAAVKTLETARLDKSALQATISEQQQKDGFCGATSGLALPNIFDQYG